MHDYCGSVIMIIGEEYTLAIAVEFILGHSQKRGPVCKNLSSSRAVDDIATKYGCQVHSTPVGEIHVRLEESAQRLSQVLTDVPGGKEDERSSSGHWR